jgi:hypothetical protein
MEINVGPLLEQSQGAGAQATLRVHLRPGKIAKLKSTPSLTGNASIAPAKAF